MRSLHICRVCNLEQLFIFGCWCCSRWASRLGCDIMHRATSCLGLRNSSPPTQRCCLVVWAATYKRTWCWSCGLCCSSRGFTSFTRTHPLCVYYWRDGKLGATTKKGGTDPSCRHRVTTTELATQPNRRRRWWLRGSKCKKK